jgi:hypothetical protein
MDTMQLLATQPTFTALPQSLELWVRLVNAIVLYDLSTVDDDLCLMLPSHLIPLLNPLHRQRDLFQVVLGSQIVQPTAHS